MRILIIYGSYSGGTMMAAEYLRDCLEETGHTVTLQRVEEAEPSDLIRQDMIVFGSCSWDRVLPDGRKLEGQLQESFEGFFSKLRSLPLAQRKFGVFALGDSRFFSHFCGAAQRLEDFVKEVGGQLAVPTLQLDQFFFERIVNEEKIRNWAGTISKFQAPNSK